MSSRVSVYAASVAAGAVVALVACIVYVAGSFAVAFGLPLLLSRFRNEGAFAGGLTIDGASVVLVAVIGFAFGFFWRFRRSRGRRSIQ